MRISHVFVKPEWIPPAYGQPTEYEMNSADDLDELIAAALIPGAIGVFSPRRSFADERRQKAPVSGLFAGRAFIGFFSRFSRRPSSDRALETLHNVRHSHSRPAADGSR